MYDSSHTKTGGDEINEIERVILITIVGVAMISDLYRNKISNRLIVSGIILCLAFAVWSMRIQTILQVIIDLSFPVILFYLLYYMGALGSGDIKLISMISGYIGFLSATRVMIIAFLIGGIWSVAMLIKHKALQRNLECLLNYSFLLLQGEYVPYETTDREPLVIPFSVCIGAALYGSMLFEGFVK